MAHLSTHVLDAVSGRPAADVAVTLSDPAGTTIIRAATDADGRIVNFGPDLDVGIYRLTFDTAAYFAANETSGFYPEVTITFEIDSGAGKYHVPLLLSPYAYSTYRGS